MCDVQKISWQGGGAVGPVCDGADQRVEGAWLREPVRRGASTPAGGLEAEAFTPERIEEFSIDCKAAGYRSPRTVRAVEPLREYFQAQGVLPPPPARQPGKADERLLHRYRDHVVDEQSLVEKVVTVWMRSAARFLAARLGLVPGETELGVAEISAYVCARVGPPKLLVGEEFGDRFAFVPKVLAPRGCLDRTTGPGGAADSEPQCRRPCRRSRSPNCWPAVIGAPVWGAETMRP